MVAYQDVDLVTVTPAIQVVGVVENAPTTLVLRKNLYADNPTDYAITDTNGNKVLTLKAKEHSVRDKRKVVDSSGNELYVLEDKIMSLHASMKAVKEGVNLFTVTDESKTNGNAHAKVVLSDIVTTSGEKQTLVIDGDWFGDGAVLSFYDKDSKKATNAVAKGSRQAFDVKPGAYDDQTYFLTIAPGIDIALIAGIAVAFDEIRRGLEYGG